MAVNRPPRENSSSSGGGGRGPKRQHRKVCRDVLTIEAVSGDVTEDGAQLVVQVVGGMNVVGHPPSLAAVGPAAVVWPGEHPP